LTPLLRIFATIGDPGEKRMCRFFFALVSVAAASAAPLCIPGASLASYEALGPAGCVVNAAIPILAGGFSYSVLASSSPSVVTPDTAIFVTPVFPGFDRFGINFTSGTFMLTGSDFVRYSIGFTWDPNDVRSADDVLETSTPVAPGFAKDTTGVCIGAAFTGTVCSMPMDTLVVSHDGITPMLTATTGDFSSLQSTVGILNTLELNGGGTGSSEIIGFANNITTVPEPGPWLMSLTALVALAARRQLAH
jgi:hypothetical protein